uniref:Uncharacterized protein n=1 Tax=Anguilla anguilla TaxID=7936 RepID=A0A0E9V1Q6_ANGAN
MIPLSFYSQNLGLNIEEICYLTVGFTCRDVTFETAWSYIVFDNPFGKYTHICDAWVKKNGCA